MSNEQHFFVYGVRRSRDDKSRMGNTTVTGGNTILVEDNITLEAMYQATDNPVADLGWNPPPPLPSVADRQGQSVWVMSPLADMKSAPMTGLNPGDTEDHDTQYSSKNPRNDRVIMVGSVLVATAAIIAVVVMFVGSQNEWSGSNVATAPVTKNTTVVTSVSSISFANITTTRSPSMTISPTISLTATSPSGSLSVYPASESPTKLLQSQFVESVSPAFDSSATNGPEVLTFAPTIAPTSAITPIPINPPTSAPSTTNPTSAQATPPWYTSLFATGDKPSKSPTANALEAFTFTASASIWTQQGQAIVGDASADLLGTAVAISADDRTIVIGAAGYYLNDSKMGYVKVYRTSSNDSDSGNMVQLGQTIYGDATRDWFGRSVDISANGNTIVIGSPGVWGNKDRPGYVRVFSLESDDNLGTNTWKQVGRDITGEENGHEVGFSVSIAEDGKTIAVGADGFDGKNGDDSGHVRVYRMDYSQLDWFQMGEDIEGEAADDWSGFSVSLSADGATVAIGSPNNKDNGIASGHVKVYQMNSAGSSWEQLGQTLYGDNRGDTSDGWGATAGWSIDLSPDGNTLAFGSPEFNPSNDQPGYVRVFSLNVSDDNIGTSMWEQIGQDIAGEANGDQFGSSVSLSNDGRTIAVGAGYNDGMNGVDSGHVRVYRMNDSQFDWSKIGGDIDGEGAYDYSGGLAVSLFADGRKVAIGSNLNDDNGADAGHVRVYVLK